MSEPLWQPRGALAARLLGAGFLASGAGLLWLQAHSIRAAVTAGTHVTYSHAAIALGEFGVALGLYWIVRGLAGYRAVRSLQEKPVALRWLGVASAVVVGGSLLALHSWLQSHGYTD